MASKKRGSQQAKQGRAAERGYRQGNKPVSRTKPVLTKKEKLHGQELGKTGRAAERGGPVNKTQVAHRRHSEQQMYANKMKNTPIKQKLSGIALDLAVTAAVSPGTLRNVQSGLMAGVNRATGREVWIHSSPAQNLPRIEPRVSPGGRPRYQKDTPLTFGVRTPAKGTQEYLPEYVREITKNYNSRGALGTAGKPQSVYVTKVPQKNIVATEATGKWGVSSAPQKVVREIQLAGKTAQQIETEIAKAAKAAGGKLTQMTNPLERFKTDIRYTRAKSNAAKIKASRPKRID